MASPLNSLLTSHGPLPQDVTVGVPTVSLSPQEKEPATSVSSFSHLNEEKTRRPTEPDRNTSTRRIPVRSRTVGTNSLTWCMIVTYQSQPEIQNALTHEFIPPCYRLIHL